MKTAHVALALTLIFVAGAAHAEEQDPLAQYLVSPQFVIEHAQTIELTQDQRRRITQTAEMAHLKAQALQYALHAKIQMLRGELKKERIDAKAARGRLDEVLDAERAVKHLHLDLLVTVSNVLTPAQRATLLDLRKKQAASWPKPQDVASRLRTKMVQVVRGARERREAGKDTLGIPERLQQFAELMQSGKHAEAEALLDRALDQLRKADAPPPKDDDKGASRNGPPPMPAAFETPEQMRTKIADLRVADVAWRKIAWKTCLLDALAASRAQHKPLILWVFIDRPVDDKRC